MFTKQSAVVLIISWLQRLRLTPMMKMQSHKLRKSYLFTSLNAIVSSKPLYKVDPETGEPITKYDPLSNTYEKVPDEQNIAYFQRAQDRQDQLQADYVGLTLQQWRDIDNESNPAQIKADRINAVKIGVTYSEYLKFNSLDPTDPTAWLSIPSLTMKSLDCLLILFYY